MVKIAVLVSGGGTNLQALIDAAESGRIKSGALSLVVSSNPEAYALARAEQHGIPAAVVARKDHTDGDSFDRALLTVLEDHGIDLIVLAGFMQILGPAVVRKYHRRMLNVHPSLIPSFCGEGFYGLRVHKAALDYGVKVTGATVHFVDEIPDGGEIIAQKAVDVLPADTPETLQKRVMAEAEWVILPKAVEDICRDLIQNTVTFQER